MNILVTGSSGLIGSACVDFFCKKNNLVVGIDNDSRSVFFGEDSSTKFVGQSLKVKYDNFSLVEIDISNRESLEDVFRKYKFDLIVHTAAQPSHDKAADIPEIDFRIKALATTYLLELYKSYCPRALFIHMSTNKVYGDNPNKVELVELEKRFDFAEPLFKNGINEDMSIDNTTHSLFGASKLSADIMVQEYGRYFDLNTVVLRGGCLTGPLHASAKQHGFLSYLIKSIIHESKYEIIGYKGKQVRDQIHAYDVVQIISLFVENPCKGEVFNIGGGKENSASIVELIEKIEAKEKINIEIDYIEKPRVGDHMCYYSDTTKLKRYLPNFNYKYNLDEIIEEQLWSYKNGR